MCSETGPDTLSKDLGQEDLEKHVGNTSDDKKSMLKSSSDFEFIVGSNLGHESCSADELFSNGLILPTQASKGSALPHVKRCHPKVSVASSPPRPPILCPTSAEISEKVLKEGIVSGCDVDDKTESNTSGEYPRSSSLKNEAKKSLLCSLSLLPRSNSVGSVPNRKKTTTMSKDKQRSSFFMTRTFSFSSSSSYHSTHQKPPSKKNYGMKYGNGVQTSHNPVLNIPSSSIGIGASNLFGFGCLLPGKKDYRSK